MKNVKELIVAKVGKKNAKTISVLSLVAIALVLLNIVILACPVKKDNEETTKVETSTGIVDVVLNCIEEPSTEITTEEETEVSTTEETTEETTEAPSTTEEVEEENKQSKMVWVTENGKKYHSSRTCSGMKEPYQVEINCVAGRTPCSKCY